MLGKGGLLGNDARLNAKRAEDQSLPRVGAHIASQSPLGGVGPIGMPVGASTAGAARGGVNPPPAPRSGQRPV